MDMNSDHTEFNKSEIWSVRCWPCDFQQILYDLLYEAHGQDHPVDQDDSWETVLVSFGNILDHLDEYQENRDFWDDSDIARVDYYAEKMKLGFTFPPLIIDGPKLLLRDGFHRMGAYLKNEVYEVPVIYLSMQVILMKKKSISED